MGGLAPEGGCQHLLDWAHGAARHVAGVEAQDADELRVEQEGVAAVQRHLLPQRRRELLQQLVGVLPRHAHKAVPPYLRHDRAQARVIEVGEAGRATRQCRQPLAQLARRCRRRHMEPS